MRNIKYIGTKAREDAFFDKTQIIWTPGKVDTVLDDAVATQMLTFREFEDAGDAMAAVGSLGVGPDGLTLGGQALTASQKTTVLFGLGTVSGPLSMGLANAADVPTIGYGASSGWGGSAIDRADSRITYWGGANIAPDNAAFGQMKSKSTSSWVGNQPFFTEFGYDGASMVIRAGIDSGKQKYLMWVDGKLAQADTEFLTATAGTQDITITFGAAKPRIITFLSTWGVHKITPATNSTLWKVERSKGRKLALIGDSWGDVSGEFLHGWGYRLALALGYSDILPSFQGGTGYYATGTAGQGRRSFLGRFADEVAAYGFDDVIVNGSINDLPSALPGVARADVIAQMDAFYDTVAVAGKTLTVFGTQYVDPTLDAVYAAQDAEIQGALNGRGAFYSTTGWLTGTGKIGSTTGSGNRDIYRVADGNHCSEAGYRYWSHRQLAAIKSVA